MPIIAPSRASIPIGNRGPRWPFGLNEASPQARGLVAWWSFAAPDGFVGDLSRSGLTGTAVNGPTWRTSEFNVPALTLASASSQYVSVTGTAMPAPGLGGPISIALWLNPTSTAKMAPLAQDNSGGTAAFVMAINANSAGAATGHWAMWFFGDTRTVFLAADVRADVVARNRPVFLVGVRTSGNTVAMYRDGELESSTLRLGGTPNIPAIDAIQVGRRNLPGFFDYTDGQVIDARIYNRILTAGDVAEMYDPSTRFDLYDEVWRRSVFLPAASGFQPAWAVGSTTMIGAGMV